MTIRKFMEHFPDIAIAPEVVTAADYLESRGKYFMLHFGYETAQAKAAQEFESDWPRDGRVQ